MRLCPVRHHIITAVTTLPLIESCPANSLHAFNSSWMIRKAEVRDVVAYLMSLTKVPKKVAAEH